VFFANERLILAFLTKKDTFENVICIHFILKKSIMDNWVKIFSHTDLLQTKLAEDVLKQNGIESHILHKPDSVIPSLGQAELLTHGDKAEEAIRILKANDFL